MRLITRLLMATIILASPAGAQENKDPKRVRLSFSFWGDHNLPTPQGDDLLVQRHLGENVFVPLFEFMDNYLGNPSSIWFTSGRTADALSRTPIRHFHKGDTYPLYQSRQVQSRWDSGLPVKIQASVGIWRRTRATLGFHKNRNLSFKEDAFIDYIQVDEAKSAIWNGRSASYLLLSRHVRTGPYEYRMSSRAWEVGGQYDVYRNRWVDLSLDAGVEFRQDTLRGDSDIKEYIYDAFLPELTVPDADPAMLRRETVRDQASYSDNHRHTRPYVGYTSSLYPHRNLALSSQVRWYFRDTESTFVPTTSAAPYSMTWNNPRWTVAFSATLVIRHGLFCKCKWSEPTPSTCPH